MKKRLAVFISGNGTNLQAIIEKIKEGRINAEIKLVISDNPEAYGLKRAERSNIKTHIIAKHKAQLKYDDTLKIIKANNIDLIILAGFMKILPKIFVEVYKNKIINLHPALLPNYGGKGMYGDNVHKSVIDAGEKISGATVHYVDEGCDTGKIIAQERINVYNFDDIESLATRIHSVEHRLLPNVITMLCE